MYVYMENLLEVVHAESIDIKRITYKCKHCFNRYNKDGRPRKNAKNVYHYHGSCGQLENRHETRTRHCSVAMMAFNSAEVIIVIDDDTIRCY
jgi:hypothetical protein